MKKTPYELIVSRLFTIGKRRAFKETLLPLLIGISLGYLIGSIISFEDIDSIDHVMKIERHAPESTLFFLRCLIMIHPEAKKAANFVAAIRDTYGKVCNQTIYFTYSKELQRKVADQFLVVVDTPLNAFHWNYYKDALVTTAEVPAHWTYIGDEQGFLVIGNLRKLVRSYNHRNAIMSIISYIFPFLQHERMSVQSGVVMTTSAIKSISKCNYFFLSAATESALVTCAKENGIKIVDPIDEEGMHLFNEKDLKTLITQTSDASHSHAKTSTSACCSDYAVSFGQMSYKDIRLVDIASTQWKVFGIGDIEEVNATYAIEPESFLWKNRSKSLHSNAVVKKKV